MNGRLYIFVVSLFLTLGLALGQANQDDGAGSEQPVEQTQETNQDGENIPPDPAEGETETTEGAPQEEQTETTQETPPEAPAADEAEDDGAAGQEAEAEDPDQEEAEQTDMAAQQDTLAALQSVPEFSMFADAVQRAGLTMTLQQEGPFTILAPTNQAFEQAGIDLTTLDQAALSNLVRNHLVSGTVSPDQLSARTNVVTLHGTEYSVSPAGDQTAADAPAAEDQVAGGGAAEAENTEEQQDQATEEQAEAESDEPGEIEPQEEQGQQAAESVAGLSIGDATVTRDAMETSGGTIYGIDTVLVTDDFGAQGVEGGGAADQSEGDGDESAAGAGAGQDDNTGMDDDN